MSSACFDVDVSLALVGSVLVLALGLAMDAMAAAATQGLAARPLTSTGVVRIALLFGGAQGLMPAIGLGLSHIGGPTLAEVDHWVAFVLLSILGARMIYGAFTGDDDERHHGDDGNDGNDSDDGKRGAGPALSFRVLLPLAIATSIDAAAAGVSLPALGAPPIFSMVVIGVVTAVLSALGAVIGGSVGARFGPRVEAFGGLCLIAMGVRILVEHLGAA